MKKDLNYFDHEWVMPERAVEDQRKRVGNGMKGVRGKEIVNRDRGEVSPQV